jgi:hypothetical protein
MFGVIAFILGVVAAILKLTSHGGDAVLWCVIIGLIAVSVEVVWGWHRGGYYHR